jgi:hypothetical protein
MVDVKNKINFFDGMFGKKLWKKAT